MAGKVPYFARNGYAVIAAAGTDTTDAATLTGRVNKVTGTDGTVGVKLQAGRSGTESISVTVWASGGSSNLKVYPPTGGIINGGSVDAAHTIPADDVAEFIPVSGTDFIVVSHEITEAAGAAGTVEANKAVVVDGSKDISAFRTVGVTNLDAGASGTAGTVDVFPTTASKGKLAITCTDQTGNTTVSLVAGEMGQATTVTIPDPGGAASFVMTAGAQTIGGVKTFSSSPVITNIDAGASGTAGSVDVFPTTAASGKLTITASDQPADHAVVVNLAAMAATRTLSLTDPLAAADFLFGSQGAVARTATADGTTTGTIAAKGILQTVVVTSDDANKIIVLPTPTPGTIVLLVNGATGYELRSSTPASIAINGGTGAGAESAIAASTLVVAVCKTATSWAAFSLVGTTLAAVEAAA